MSLSKKDIPVKLPSRKTQKKKLVFLIGPTAIGKSKAAIALAKKLKTEIISCDSMQIYKGMDIVTSKDSVAERKAVRHHFIDIVSPAQQYNVARYRNSALSICEKLYWQGKIPLFVGGTGLYYSTVIDGIFPKVPEDRAIRAKLYKLLKNKGNIYLYNRLKKIDPAAAKKIHPNDSRRVIRALEVYSKTGKPISVMQEKRVGLGDEYDIKIFALNSDRELLYQKINQRVEKMFKEGLLSEVRKLLKEKLSKTARCAIGINELEGYIKGKYSLEEAKELIKRNSRHYAKRQLTWFRKDKRVRWINISRKENTAEIAKRIYKVVSASEPC